ncbi:MAG: hypothetical protein GY801_35580 [bacterium]|nr:hypothetical protein [bacterium]
MKECTLFCKKSTDAQQGVALIVALSVLAILSIIVLAIFNDATSELRRSGIARNSERALKLAETGVQVARAMLEEGGVGGSLSSVDGFSDGGYFFASMGSGMPGNEKWEQWHYDSQITGNNVQSEISVPLRPVWMKEAYGRNGLIESNSRVYINNLYGIVSGGAYFPIEAATTTNIRAVHEFTGESGTTDTPLKYNTADNVSYTWEGDTNGDKTVAINSYNNGYAINMSPMASYSNFSTVPDKSDPVITHQTLYHTYAGGSGSSNSDTTSTVRIQAVNALCNASDNTEASVLWEFDTQLHGYGTAPAVFDPSPNQPGDEIVYFAVLGQDDANLRDKESVQKQPNEISDDPDKIYIYAIVDETGSAADECSKTGRYRLKWAHPFPDPDVADWTDYPTEEATGTNGMFPPYVRRSSDMASLPEDDLLFDYRDSIYDDDMQNQVRGNEYIGVFQPASISPVVIKPLYELDGIDLSGSQMVSENRIDTIDGALQNPNDKTSVRIKGDPADPFIELYLVYVAHPYVKYSASNSGKSMGYNLTDTRNWGRNYELKKYTNLQTRVIALRDRLDGSCDSDNNASNGHDGDACAWSWKSAKSRFPVFKWNYRVPGWDPSRSDQRPWNGYGEFVWDTWFEQQIAPMVGIVEADQDGSSWGSISNQAGGERQIYPTLYVTYESLSHPDESGNNVNGPTTGNGSPVNFGSDQWGDNHLLIMGLRDTWDDYMQGKPTNPMWDAMLTQDNPYAVPVQSKPVEDYWTHKHDDIICAADGSMIPRTYTGTSEVVISYPDSSNMALAAANDDKVGFARPYVWTESLWEENVDNGDPNRDLDKQGWDKSGLSSSGTSNDVDVEGETSAMCVDCLDGAGLIISVFNHDLSGVIEDLRMHAVNARTGQHSWDYHMPAVFTGDFFNATPAIANGKVFVAFASRNGDRRGAFLKVLNADTGAKEQSVWFDNDASSRTFDDARTAGRADALIMSPTIANGAVYVGTYHFNGTTSDQSDDTIRIYAFSPVMRLFSMGVYPLAYTNETTIPDLISPVTDSTMARLPRVERKLQVWITGAGSKWEEIRETRP